MTRSWIGAAVRITVRFWSRRTIGASIMRIVLCVVLLLFLAYVVVWAVVVRMPGHSFRGPLPPLDQEEQALAAELRRDVEALAGRIGERNTFYPAKLAEAAGYIEAGFNDAGYDVERQTYEILRRPCHNLIVEIAGSDRASEILVVGAHYDSVYQSPGANDNASGVAAVLALARRFAGRSCARTLRFVAFVNEEPPYFQTDRMGSLVYARRCRERGDRIVGMISVETIGCFSDVRGTQRYPPPFSLYYPSSGNFVGFVADLSSAGWVRRVVGAFREHARFPSQGATVPFLPQAGWSDHWSFWQQGYAGLMVTDTAPFRYEHYHTSNDTPEKLDYERMARVVSGLERAVAQLVQRGE